MGENIADWSTAPASNATVNSIDWAEGMAPAQVNNSARQEMADVADWHHNQAEWINRGETPVFVAATQFKINGVDVSGVYTVGRRVQLVAPTPGTIFGSISAVSFSTDTTVTIDWDTSTELSSETLTRVSVGIIQGAAASQSYFSLPVGAIIDFGTTAAEPVGWKFCNGQSLNRTTFANLFTVISTFYGAASTSVFSVPDIRGRTTIALDNMGGTAANVITSTAADTLGGTFGQESTSPTVTITGGVTSHELTEAELPSSLSVTIPTGNVSDPSSGSGRLARGSTVGAGTQTITLSSVGSGTAHPHDDTLAATSTGAMSVTQPSMALIKIIKAF